MHLSDNNIFEYQQVYRQFFHVELTRKEAIDGLSKLVYVLELTYKPMTEAELEQVMESKESAEDRFI